jgi:ribonuclease P protein component
MEKGQVFHCPFFMLRVGLGNGPTGFSVAVPKKVANRAYGRNRIRRQIYEIIRNMDKKIDADRLVVVILKQEALKLSFRDLEQELEKVFVKSGIIE